MGFMRKIIAFGVSCALVSGFASPVWADYEDGVNAAFAGDYDTALKEFTAAAENGLDLAQYNLAILYFTGQGVERDLGKAFHWTEAAALQGHVNAQFNLGSLYMEGDGVARDVSKAVEWFGRAARAGHPDAAYFLADIYNRGDGVKRDRVQAHAWASQAVYNEQPEAAALKQEIEDHLNAEQLGQARRLFARWQIE